MPKTKQDEVREKLINKLANKFGHGDRGVMLYCDEVADFIIEDRKKVVAPLVKYKDECKEPWGYPKSHNAVDQTLTNAGVEI